MNESEAVHLRVDVIEDGGSAKRGWIPCVIGRHFQFGHRAMASYFLSEWRPVLFDLFVVVAAVEFCDRLQRRSQNIWGRAFSLCIPVHDSKHWNSDAVRMSLLDSLRFLTGDKWDIEFKERINAEIQPVAQQQLIPLQLGAKAVIPFSDGLDSKSVSALYERDLGNGLVRVRVGKGRTKGERDELFGKYFTSIPYRIDRRGIRFSESSSRARGFKFSCISGAAASLSKAGEVIIPESGQGIVGPALLVVGQGYPDYRNHPAFLRRVERFMGALLGTKHTYVFPRIWNTKGETIEAFIRVGEPSRKALAETRSCWMDNRMASVDGRRRQCGICAACLLRRMSLHYARSPDLPDNYILSNLASETLAGGVDSRCDIDKVSKFMSEYAIAGVLHLEHLSSIRSSEYGQGEIVMFARSLADSMNMKIADVTVKLNRLIDQHAIEWRSFVGSLGDKSFILQLIRDREVVC